MTLVGSLSLEEKDELARSEKKVKDVNHAGFSEGPSSGPSSPRLSMGSWKQGMSFKDKLVGEIPGAFTQAFNFEDDMEDVDADSDEDVETLRRGLVAVKFSKDFKQHIRKPWARTLIVKVHGRDVGLSFLQSKLLAMWKPAGRLDCVDLGHGFFLTRLSLKEDFENVLRKGPWFFGDHFLSLRPWEPNFKPALANVSSIAVWIRLNELPIEYYNAEALQHIGRAIGNVLRVDTFTATEARGRFARLCMQIDVEKPLVTAVMIGKLEQEVSYEGIQKLCFECGRMGHRKETCPYIIRQDLSTKKAQKEVGVSMGEMSHEKCEDNGPNSVVGSNGELLVAEQEVVRKDTYGPWVMVARKRAGTKVQRYGGSPPNQRTSKPGFSNGFFDMEAAHINQRTSKPGFSNGFFDMETVHTREGARAESSNGPLKEMKRKLSPPKVLEKAQVEAAIKKIVKHDHNRAQPRPTLNSEPKPVSGVPTHVNSGQRLPIQSSVKGKKDLARHRGTPVSSASAVDRRLESECTGEHLKGNTEDLLTAVGNRDGESYGRASNSFQFTASSGNPRDCFGGEESLSDSSLGVLQHDIKGSIGVHLSTNRNDRKKHEEWVESSNNNSMVIGSGGYAFAGGRAEASVGKLTSVNPDECGMQCDSKGVPIEKESAREAVNTQADGVLQSPCDGLGGVTADQMDLEAVGDVDADC